MPTVSGRPPNAAYRAADDKPNYVDSGTLTDPNGTTRAVLTHTAMTYDAHRNAIGAAASP